MRDVAITPEKYLTEDEYCKLMTWCWLYRDTDWITAIRVVRMVLGTGMRVSELPTLRAVTDCTPDGFIIVRQHVRRAYEAGQPDSGEWIASGSKTGRARLIKVTPEYKPFYLQHLREVGNNGLMFKKTRKNLKDPYFSIKYLQKLWYAALEAAGVRRMSIHCGRHTWATWELATKRLTLVEVQAVLGHRNSLTTTEVYAHAIVHRMYETENPKWWAIAKHGLERRELLKAV